MTVTKAARRLGVGRPALSNFLNGRAALSQQMARRLERAFGADAAALLDLQARYDAVATARGRQPVAGPSFAPSVTTIKAGQIADWADRIEARQHLAVLVRKLIHCSGTGFSRVDFPGHDSAERWGWDGWVATSAPTAWVPDGDSGWEFGCSQNPQKKANKDFDRRRVGLDAEKEQITFVFVTPRRWPGKRKWESAKQRLGIWKDVRAYDADDLEQWMEQCVPAQVWFAEQLGQPVHGFVSLDRYWSDWADATDPALPSALFDRDAEEHSDAFREWLKEPSGRRFTVAADSRAEAIAFMACLMNALPDDHELSHRGIVFETAAAAERLASSTPGAFVAIAATREAAQVFQTGPKMLRCVVPVPRNRVAALEREPDITLELLGVKEFFAALTTMNISHDQAVRLERDSGRSPTVLRRRLLPEVSQPEWAGADTAKVLAPLSLAGAWNTASEADRKVVSRLAGCNHESVEAYVAAQSVEDDPPVWSKGEYRGVVSRMDSFFATVSYWTPGLLDRFFEVAQDVLSERDPALDLPEGEQWMAGVYGKVRRHSAALRKGLRESLVLLALYGARHLDCRLGLRTREGVRSVFHRLLDPLDLERLRSCDADLPDLAEAVPETFLECIEADLKSENSAALALMKPVDSDLLTGSCPRANLLWALERLAWEPDHFPRVVNILGRLSEVEIDDNWVHKPRYSLAALFDPYNPQTTAPLADRLGMLRMLTRRYPETGWSVALGEKWHPDFGVLQRSHRPMWRGDASAYQNVVPSDEAERFIRSARDTCFDWPRHDQQTLAGLIRIFPRLEPAHRRRVVQLIEKWEASSPPEGAAATLADRVRGMRRLLKSQHAALRAELAPVVKRLDRGDHLAGCRWLFRSEWAPIHEYCDTHDDSDFDEAERAVRKRRLAALRRIREASGLDGILNLVQSTEAHHAIGNGLAEILRTRGERQSFVDHLLDQAPSGTGDRYRVCLSAFLWRQEASAIQALWEHFSEAGRVGDGQRFLQSLPYRHAAPLLDDTTEDIRSQYWRDFRPDREHHSREQKNALIDRLLEADRPHAAFCVVTANWDHVHSSLLLRLLNAIGHEEGSQAESQVIAQELPRAFESLARRSDVPDAEKAALELRFFQSLRHSQFRMPSLAHRMAASPEIFVEAIARFFGRSDGKEDPPELRLGDEERRRELARAALQILEWFERVPGTDEAGAVALERLKTWTGEARSALRYLGRTEVGDQRIGRLLAKASKDESGRWPRQEVCEVLEEIATKDVRIGFVAGGLDRRGVWTRGLEEGGHQERNRAARYRARAASVAFEFPFVARALREIAEHYDDQAVTIDTRAELEVRGVE